MVSLTEGQEIAGLKSQASMAKLGTVGPCAAYSPKCWLSKSPIDPLAAVIPSGSWFFTWRIGKTSPGVT